MFRSIGMVLVIWGLIAQPLMAAMPAPMTDDSSHSLIMVDPSIAASAMVHHGNQEEPLKAPCHENTTETASSESCDNCDIDCMDGICASSCVISGAAAFQEFLVNIDLLNSSLTGTSFGARAYGLPSRIFHPPKHA